MESQNVDTVPVNATKKIVRWTLVCFPSQTRFRTPRYYAREESRIGNASLETPGLDASNVYPSASP